MGVFDEISHVDCCIHCGAESRFVTQVKHEYAWLKFYGLGDRIGCASFDGVLEGWTRPNCPQCGEELHFNAIIENGRIVRMSTRCAPF